MDFQFWYNEVAEMPQQDADGQWFDMETGIYFDPNPLPKEKALKVAPHPFEHERVPELKSRVERLMISLKRSTLNPILSESKDYIDAALTTLSLGEAALTQRQRKPLLDYITKNSEVSRLSNQILNEANKHG